MLDKALPSYDGELSPEQISQGISFAQANALRLLEDAKLLLEAKRFPSAAAMAILSMEERGKTIILTRLAIVEDAADVKSVWREYRSHRAKNSGWIIPQLFSEGTRTMQSFAAAVDPKGEHSKELDALKQISLYTDCLGNRHWSVPEEVVNEELARSMVAAAEMMWGGRSVTVRELELRTEIIRPNYKEIGMAAAMVRWQEAMVAEGLSEMDPEKFAAFIQGTPFRSDVE